MLPLLVCQQRRGFKTKRASAFTGFSNSPNSEQAHASLKYLRSPVSTISCANRYICSTTHGNWDFTSVHNVSSLFGDVFKKKSK